ncbi:hypothetical protein D3C80_1629780 [compost metagenome]
MSPAAAPLLLPLTVCATSCSVALMMSSPATVLMITVGTVISTRTSRLTLLILPALSLAEALTVTLPFRRLVRSAAGTFRLQLPLACTSAR